MNSAAVEPVRPGALRITGAWPLILGLCALAVPTLVRLSQLDWSRESGAHGPIILATGAWLLIRQAEVFRREAAPGHPLVTAGVLAVSLAAYVFGRAFDFMTLEAGGLYGAGLAVMHAIVGPRVMLRHWFPFFYLAFAIPPPQYLLDHLTAPLKEFVSMAATNLLSMIGFPISRQGVIIYIAQYELLVEDACSGMNSLVGLTAIGLFYVYLMRGGSWLHSLLLTACVIPIAILANLVRIMTLVLVTYNFGNAAAQGAFHGLAGMVLFTTALLMVFGADKLLGLLLDRRERRA